MHAWNICAGSFIQSENGVSLVVIQCIFSHRSQPRTVIMLIAPCFLSTLRAWRAFSHLAASHVPAYPVRTYVLMQHIDPILYDRLVLHIWIHQQAGNMRAFDPKHPHASTEVLEKHFLLKKKNKKHEELWDSPWRRVTQWRCRRGERWEAVLTRPGINRLLKNWVEVDGLK